MNSSTYGTAELQGDASPSSYRLSKVAKIALGGSGTSRAWEAYNSLGSSLGGKPVASTLKDQVQDLQARVAAIEKYLQAAGGGSGNSRNQYHQAKTVYAGIDGGGR